MEGGLRGWFSSAWQKSPIPFGVSEPIGRSWTETDLPAGNSWVDDSVVPAGEIWVLTQWMSVVTSGSVTRFRMFLHVNGSDYETWAIVTPVNDTRYDRQGWWVLGPGDYLRIRVENATLNDDMNSTVTGFRLDIDQ